MPLIIRVLKSNEDSNYKRFDSTASLIEEDIPKTIHNRRMTDKYFLVAFILVILFVISGLIYTLSYADISRLIKGYDNCGNVCGKENVEYAEWNCTGKDFTDKQFFLHGECVEGFASKVERPRHTISDYDFFEEYEYIGYKDSKTFEDVLPYLHTVGWRLAVLSIFSLGLCIILIYLLRYATAPVVYGSLYGVWLCILALCGLLWSYAASEKDLRLIICACLVSLIALGLLLVIALIRNRVRLTSLLLKESMKVLFEIPKIFFISFMALLGLLIIAASWVVTTIYISSAGKLEGTNEKLHYEFDAFMIVTICFNCIIAYWAMEFVLGVQNMIISGAVAKWYFTTDKSTFKSPILASTAIAIKFHLGTAAFGSLLVTLVGLVRGILKCIANHPRARESISCCLGCIKGFLSFLSTNAFVVTAIHGTPFYKSGKHAVNLHTLDLCDTATITAFGSFVLALSKALVVIASALISNCVLSETQQDYFWYSMTAMVFVSFSFVRTMLTTTEIVMDTVYLCFCEDCLINDGGSKPYAMPKGLMEFVGECTLKDLESANDDLPTL